MLQNIVLFIIILMAFLYIGRRIYRVFAHRGPQCGCGVDICPGCPGANTHKDMWKPIPGQDAAGFKKTSQEILCPYEKDHQDA